MAGGARLLVSERYLCMEGEGRTLGAPTWLIRLAGCDLRCFWCDSKKASFSTQGATRLGAKTLAREAARSGAAWASLSGGEPLFRPETELKGLAELCGLLAKAGLKVKVESNGLHWRPGLLPEVALWSVAPKWDRRRAGPGQTEQMRHDLPRLRRLIRACPGRVQVKLVLGPGPEELAQALAILKALGPEGRKVPVFLTPDGLAAGEDAPARLRRLSLAVQAKARSFKPWDLRVSPQLHVLLHGHQPRR